MIKILTITFSLLLILVPAPINAAQNSTGSVISEVSDDSIRCKGSSKFRERAFRYPRYVKKAGRCVRTRNPKIKHIGSRWGHHPSANKALDIMVNLRSSCTKGREVGNKTARYLMNNSRRYNVKYLIWKNRYWSSNTRRKPPRYWRYMGRGGCTHGHYDHVHAAFK